MYVGYYMHLQGWLRHPAQIGRQDYYYAARSLRGLRRWGKCEPSNAQPGKSGQVRATLVPEGGIVATEVYITAHM